ncbi:hypothetical protein PHYBOEH_004012 [Phytophthora boehmeriae]|uniref:Uncharacterized protein n=1 Tax=Phytophthora boehmeriae TaxID=109152 RepID=A0A8T1WPC8_9STRA|nr:hypothetical protein PHYBOEH_004012 [Phytophthora boehmeriae]
MQYLDRIDREELRRDEERREAVQRSTKQSDGEGEQSNSSNGPHGRRQAEMQKAAEQLLAVSEQTNDQHETKIVGNTGREGIGGRSGAAVGE